MSYTNSTPNYKLPQYVADDKPTYLGDFNKAMLDIDTAIKSNDTNISSISGSVDTAVAQSTEALSQVATSNETAQSAKTIAEATSTQVDNLTTRVGNVETQANSAVSTANNANRKATSANSTANTAMDTASTANSTANAANTTAEIAKTTADNALASATGTTLFESSSGASYAEVTLSQSINNFSCIEIEYTLISQNIQNNKSTGRIPVQENLYIFLDMVRPGVSYIQMISEEIKINGSTLTNIGNAHITFQSNGTISNWSTNDALKILRITAY